MDAQKIIHQFSFLEMPIGVYVVAPDGKFLACNRLVRELLRLPLEGEVRASLAQFYADPRARHEVLQKVCVAEERGAHLEKEIIRLRVESREIFVEDYCKPLRDPTTHEIAGYVGCLVDVTADYELHQREEKLARRVEELTFDIGRILHANTSTLLMAQQTLDGIAEALSQRPIQEIIARPLEDLDERLIQEAGWLANALDRLIEPTDAERRRAALPATQWDALAARVTPLRQVRDLIPGVEMRVPSLRSVAHEIAAQCQAIAPGVLPRELIRDVVRAAAQLENTACLMDTIMTRMAIIQMDATLRSLRDFITADIRVHEEKKRLSLKLLIEQAITQVAEFARSSRVEIVRRDREFDLPVEGIERDLVRALSNLLHNAIKYTWRRDRARAPWVTIRAYMRDAFACVEIENWGVPIAREEIEQGLVFQLGYRGKWSKDRGRLGTGIGLTDAQRTAQAHYGELHVASRPAHPGWVKPEEPDYYNQPFVTTVTFCLPEALKR